MRAKILALALVLYAVPSTAGSPPYIRGPISNTYNQAGTSLYYQQMSRTSGRTTVADKPFEGSRLSPNKTLYEQQVRTAREVAKLNGPTTLPASYLTQPVPQAAFRGLKLGQQVALNQAVERSYQAWKLAENSGMAPRSDATATLRAYSYLLSAPQQLYLNTHMR
jgi:hypothetical protein